VAQEFDPNSINCSTPQRRVSSVTTILQLTCPHRLEGLVGAKNVTTICLQQQVSASRYLSSLFLASFPFFCSIFPRSQALVRSARLTEPGHPCQVFAPEKTWVAGSAAQRMALTGTRVTLQARPGLRKASDPSTPPLEPPIRRIPNHWTNEDNQSHPKNCEHLQDRIPAFLWISTSSHDDCEKAPRDTNHCPQYQTVSAISSSEPRQHACQITAYIPHSDTAKECHRQDKVWVRTRMFDVCGSVIHLLPNCGLPDLQIGSRKRQRPERSTSDIISGR